MAHDCNHDRKTNAWSKQPGQVSAAPQIIPKRPIRALFDRGQVALIR
jgi:hypothetical protein